MHSEEHQSTVYYNYRKYCVYTEINLKKKYRSNMFYPWKMFSAWLYCDLKIKFTVLLGCGEGRTDPAIGHPEDTGTTSYSSIFHSDNFGDQDIKRALSLSDI